jgi:hypothetical protein
VGFWLVKTDLPVDKGYRELLVSLRFGRDDISGGVCSG